LTDTDEVGEARRTLGRQLALLRQAAGYSQHEFAPLTLYGRSTVANVEVGRQRVPHSFWATCDRLLDANGLLAAGCDRMQLLEARTRVVVARELSLSTRPDLPPSADKETTGTRVVDDVAAEDKTAEIAGLLGALTTGRPPALTEQQAVHGDAFAGASPDEVAHRLLERFLELDDEQGGDRLYRPLSEVVSRLAPVVEDGRAGGVGLSAFGQLAQMTGWLALDSDRHGAARRHLSAAVYAAHEADEPALAASALAYMSLQDTYRGRPKSALSLAKTALQASNGSVSRLTKTMLATRLARAHAVMGNKKQSLVALDAARRSYHAPPEGVDPLWISYVDEIELSAQEGACYLELRLPREASANLKYALHLLRARAPHRVRDQVHYLSRLAKCDLLDYEVEAACKTAHEALRLAGFIGSPRIINRLGEFNDALQPFARNEAARDFRERFAVTTKSICPPASREYDGQQCP
jgi:tetratricopeptide (TPR) repeat protein